MIDNCCSSVQPPHSPLPSVTIYPYNRKLSSSSNSSPSSNSFPNPSPTNPFTKLSSLKDPKILTATTTTISIKEISSENPCFTCQTPCSIHPSYPSNLNINHKENLHSTVQPHTRHIIISTGRSDWNKIIELDSGSLSAELYKYQEQNQKENKQDNKILITNSNRKNSTLSFLTFLSFWGHDILIYPDNLIVQNVTTRKVKEFYDQFLLNKKLDDEKIMKPEENGFFTEKIPYKAVILICGHKRRDIRCGIVGPILKNEFEKVLKEKQMDLNSIGNQGVPVYLSSHVGGHQFAGNVIIYQNGHGIWYGYVTPCHVQMIIDKTVIEGKIIKELYRGSMIGGKMNQASLDW